MAWTLKHGVTTQTFEAWGLSLPVITALNQSAGEMRCEMAGDAWATLPFEYEDEVVVLKDGVTFWRGYYLRPERVIGDGEETIVLVFADPWHLLQRATYQRGSYLTQVNNTQVVLFAEAVPGVSFSRFTVGYEIAAVLSQAGVTASATPSDTGFTPQPITLRSPTYADTLRAILRKIPDTITSWSHGESASTLVIRRRADASPVTLALGAGNVVVSKRILPRYDLQVRGVVINQVYQIDGDEITAVVDSAGATTGARVLRDTITLMPPRTVGVTETATVFAETYDASTAAFWKKYGGLNNDAADISVTSVTTSGSPLGKIMTGGQIPNWLNVSAHLVQGTWTAKLAFKVYIDPADTSKGYKIERGTSQISLWTTDLEGLYTKPGGLTEIPGDDAVTGAAAALYASLSVLQYEGEIVTMENEVSGSLKPGDRLHLSGGRTEWETMGAQIHAVTWDIDSGKTTLAFGPSLHLSPGDFAELIRDQRRDPHAGGLQAQADGVSSSSGGTLEGGTPPVPNESAGLDTVTEEFKATVNGWEFYWKADGGKFTIKKTGDIARQFLVDTNAGTFDQAFQVHVTGPNDEQVILKPRPTKICMIEAGEVVTKDCLVFRSDHVDDLTF